MVWRSPFLDDTTGFPQKRTLHVSQSLLFSHQGQGSWQSTSRPDWNSGIQTQDKSPGRLLNASQRGIIPLSFFSTKSWSGLMKNNLNSTKIPAMCELSYGNRFVAIHYLFIFARLKSLMDRSINYHFTDQVRLLNKPRITMLTCRYKWVFLNRINTVPHVR